ncbi:hypothetical protein D910_06161 [Dendroctonus ponderosae]|uniref:Uncharacterized protein n=1 Tax=Dendroctonus ponderosae TaxID=77166 RepID=U4U4E5_DENPD|nr:hypothetical protein D910_06161 [Dendroctonus ponderosae]
MIVVSVPDHIRPRVCSLPEKTINPRLSDDLYRLRTFSITNKGVVNCGDSIINRRSRSNTSVNSITSSPGFIHWGIEKVLRVYVLMDQRGSEAISLIIKTST